MSDNLPAPPPPPVLSPPPASTALVLPAPTYAGFWIRFLAWLIDTFVLFLLRLGTGAVIRLSAGLPALPSWRMRGWSDASFASFDGIGCAQELVGLALWWLYHALFESSTAQGTLGKQALGLKVTDLFGRRISFARASGRTFAKILSTVTLLIGYVIAAFTLRKQALHDFVAETVVLKGWKSSE